MSEISMQSVYDAYQSIHDAREAERRLRTMRLTSLQRFLGVNPGARAGPAAAAQEQCRGFKRIERCREALEALDQQGWNRSYRCAHRLTSAGFPLGGCTAIALHPALARRPPSERVVVIVGLHLPADLALGLGLGSSLVRRDLAYDLLNGSESPTRSLLPLAGARRRGADGTGVRRRAARVVLAAERIVLPQEPPHIKILVVVVVVRRRMARALLATERIVFPQIKLIVVRATSGKTPLHFNHRDAREAPRAA